MGSGLLLLCVLLIFLRGEALVRYYVRRRPDRLLDHVNRTQPQISRKLFFLARVLGGLRTDFQRYRGPLPRVFLVVSNHQSLADIPVLALTFPGHSLRFLAKKELGRGIPYVSAVLRLGGHCLISRTANYREGQQELKRFAGLADQGICPVVFPEGTRSRTGRVRDFFAGAVRIILESHPVPVLSVAMDGGYRMSSLPKILNRMRGTLYRVKPLTLYPAPRGKREILELLETIHGEIAAQVNTWRDAETAGRRERGGLRGPRGRSVPRGQ
jgi:1-acyl-sn-glycerol-3-phosphate acyltransferase